MSLRCCAKNHSGFTMLEAIATLAIAALVIISLLAVYDRCNRVSQSVNTKIDDSSMPAEILQRISEDLDRLAGPGSTATVEIKNNFASGFPGAQITITTKIPDKNNKPVTLEQVIWQTTYDLASKRLMLWRCHSGLVWEDKLLDEQERADWSPDRHVFIPMCSGLSFFKIQVPQQVQQNAQKAPSAGQQLLSSRRQRAQNQLQAEQAEPEMQLVDTWQDTKLPPAITVTVSFAAPLEGQTTGGVDVPDELKIVRTMMLDRTKNINFKYIALSDANSEPNNSTPSDPNKTGRSAGNKQQSSDAARSEASGASSASSRMRARQ